MRNVLTENAKRQKCDSEERAMATPIIQIYNSMCAGGFYKLISWDFGAVFEQIAVRSEGA